MRVIRRADKAVGRRRAQSRYRAMMMMIDALRSLTASAHAIGKVASAAIAIRMAVGARGRARIAQFINKIYPFSELINTRLPV